VTVVAGPAPSGRLLRWLMVVGALFAVALFGGSSCADGPRMPVSTSGYAACPNVILQVSLPLTAEAGGMPDGGRDAGDVVADACLFLVVALAGLALAGATGRPLLIFLAFWWARMPLRRRERPATAGSMWSEPLRI
jgi:hypothetical protein